jgi:hypothetical protein
MRVALPLLIAGIAFGVACSSSESDNNPQQPAAGSAGAAGAEAGVPDADAAADAAGDVAVEQGDGCTQPKAPEPSACDAIQQDCDCGKCVLFKQDENSKLETGCGPVRGDDGPGEACTAHNLQVGDDSCMAGYHCSKLGTPANAPSDQVCMKHCSTNADCSTAEYCSVGTGKFGWCIPRCDPFTDFCYAGMGCFPYPGADGQGYLACFASYGSKQPGEACVANGDCALGLACVSAGATKQCAAYCDADHPCPAGDSGADAGELCKAVPNSNYMTCTP